MDIGIKMGEPTYNFDDPNAVHSLDAILNELAQDLDASPATFHDLLQISEADLGTGNIQNINTAMEYFRCVENNKIYDQVEFVDYLINVTDVLNYHTAMGTNRVSDQLAFYKEKLVLHREHLRRIGVVTDKDFVGRKEDMDKIIGVLSGVESSSFVGVCICGLGGMGKTSLANEVCYQLYNSKLKWKIIRIDLRERESLLDLLSLTLAEFSEVFSSTNVPDMQSKLWEAIPNIKRRTILLYDNMDELLRTEGGMGRRVLQFLQQFLGILAGRQSDVPIKLLITSRQKLIPDEQSVQQMSRLGKTIQRMGDLLLEIELKKLTKKEANVLFEKLVDKERKRDGKAVADIIHYCGYCPLAIRTTCSAINGGLADIEVIRYNLKISSEKGGLTSALQVQNCLQQTFTALTREHQTKLLRLSVFHTAKFDIQAASAVLDRETYTSQVELLSLKTRHFVEITDDCFRDPTWIDVSTMRSSKLRYSLHPLVFMFLQELLKTGNYHDIMSSARYGFTRHYEKVFLKIGKEMEKNCMRAWRLIEENKQHLMNLLKSDPIPCAERDMKDRILLCTQMVLIGNLLLGDFHRIQRIEKMLKSSHENGNHLEYLFWMIEKASFFHDLDRNELTDKYLNDIEMQCNTVFGKGNELAPVFGMFFLLKGKYFLKLMDPAKALMDLEMALKLFNEHRFVRHRYLYHVTKVYEKMGEAHLMEGNPEAALDYLSAAFTESSEKVENFYNLDLPSQIANMGLRYYMKGKMELDKSEQRNLENAKKHFEDSIRYYKKAMTLDCEMNLHIYDNYADKLVKRAESYLELGLLGTSGAFSEAVKDIKEADDLRRKNLQPPHYKLTHTPHLVGKILLLKGKYEYERKQKSNALNHLWEGIMYYEITRDMIKCGGLHPLHIHRQEYKEIKSEHFWALQQAREDDKIPDAIRFYKDFESGRFEERRLKARSEQQTIKNSEFIPIDDLKAEMLMARNTGFNFVPMNEHSNQGSERNDEHLFDGCEFVKLEKQNLFDFDKVFLKMDRQEKRRRKQFENPDYVPSASSSDEEEDDDTMDTYVESVKFPENMKDVLQDLNIVSNPVDKKLATKTEQDVDESMNEPVEETGQAMMDKVSRKPSTESLSSREQFLKERRERFKQKRSRDHSMQLFLDNIEEETSKVGRPVIRNTKTLSQDKSFDAEMPVLEYLTIVAKTDLEEKKKLLEKYPSVMEELSETEITEESVTERGSRKHKLQRGKNVENSGSKSSRDAAV